MAFDSSGDTTRLFNGMSGRYDASRCSLDSIRNEKGVVDGSVHHALSVFRFVSELFGASVDDHQHTLCTVQLFRVFPFFRIFGEQFLRTAIILFSI
jgi:hypothetical protein